MLASEVTPFAKTGGLADVAGALPKVLHEMGHDVRVIMPRYGSISERKFVLRDVIRLKEIPVQMGDNEYVTSVKSAFIPDSKVQVYFLEYKPLFGRNELYVDSETGTDFYDNAHRFMLYCRAVLATIKLLHWKPQVIHSHDWQAALVPWLLKHDFADDPFFDETASLLSIHNMAYQGSFSSDLLEEIGLPDSLREKSEELDKAGNINFLKAGILSADAIATVSPTYSQEIQTSDDMGAGLRDVLIQRKEDIYGILNGVDYDVWNPEMDTFIKKNYGADSLEDKAENKKDILEKAGLPFEPETPLVGIISRLAEQKGFDLIEQAIEQMMNLGIQLVVLGTGEPKYHKLLKDISQKYNNKVKVFLTFSEELAHQIEAGSDIFLMPSRFEPSGLNQLYSLQYGTIPVVRKTGGLADTVTDFVSNPEKGNGFVFEEYAPNAMLAALQNAVKTFSDKKTWTAIQKRGISADYSWYKSSENYIELYKKVIQKKKTL